jgi:hypothetical protein
MKADSAQPQKTLFSAVKQIRKFVFVFHQTFRWNESIQLTPQAKDKMFLWNIPQNMRFAPLLLCEPCVKLIS